MEDNQIYNAPISEKPQMPSMAKLGYQNSNNNNNKSKYIKVIVGIILVLGVLAGVFFFVLKKNPSEKLNPISDKGGINTTVPANLMNPLTGKMFTEESAGWFDQRPLGVMINNYIDARPQSGLNEADIVYEVVAEGGITRFLAFFLTNTPEKIGPVRSTREYYLVLVKELSDAMIMHIGWSPQALEAIETWPVRSLARGGASFWRDETRNVATEHTAYVNGKDLRELALDLGWEGKGEIQTYKFKDSKDVYATYSPSTEITIDFWYKGDYTGIFKYDENLNTYLRFTGYDSSDQPIAHVDQETKEQVSVDNLVVQFVSETPIAGDDKNRLTYELVGSGEALVFIDGKVIPATWNKASRDERTLFYDKSGKEVEFNRGKFWISIVPDRNVDQVIYK